jgi:hypothetical protein
MITGIAALFCVESVKSAPGTPSTPVEIFLAMTVAVDGPTSLGRCCQPGKTRA